jgi:hypothetical protein
MSYTYPRKVSLAGLNLTWSHVRRSIAIPTAVMYTSAADGRRDFECYRGRSEENKLDVRRNKVVKENVRDRDIITGRSDVPR